MLTETWIKSEYEAHCLKLNNYTHYYNLRTGKIGGGVSIYAHNSIKHHKIEDKYICGNNFLWIHADRQSLDIAVIYKPGHTNTDEFIHIYEAQLEKMKRAIVFGDFNYDLLKLDANAKKYESMLSGTKYFILNNIDSEYCTRIDQGQRKSILDHTCTNLRNNEFHMTIIDTPISDHHQI